MSKLADKKIHKMKREEDDWKKEQENNQVCELVFTTVVYFSRNQIIIFDIMEVVLLRIGLALKVHVPDTASYIRG
jgi:hypothetical protein